MKKSVKKRCLLLAIAGLSLVTPALAQGVPLDNYPMQIGEAPVISECDQSLQDMRETVGKLKRTCSDIVHEVERVQAYVFPTPIDSFGYFMDPVEPYAYYYPTDGNPYGSHTGELLPPRKKWMDYYANQLDQLMTVLNSDVTNTVFPEDAQKLLSPNWDVMRDTLKDLTSNYSELKTAMKGPDYDNQYIARLASEMRDDICGMDSIRKHVMSLMKSESKKAQAL